MLDEIVEIWNEAFGDSREEILKFLNLVGEDSVLTIERDGRIVSQLFLIDGKVVSDGIEYKSYYLYAAATLRSYRGKGIMAELIRKAVRKAKDSGVSFMVLMPGEKSLYDYYFSLGFYPCCKVSEYYGSVDNFPKLNFSEINKFIHQSKIYDYALDIYSDSGYEVFRNNEGFVIYKNKDNCIHIKEWYSENVVDLIKSLSVYTSVDEFKINLPSVSDKVKKENHGMILPIDINLSKDDYYLDFVLD